MIILLYYITLFISPQLWIEPFVGLRTDIIVYPLWFFALILNGKINQFFRFNKQDTMFLLFILWTFLTVLANSKNIYTQQTIVDYIKWFVLYRMISLTVDSDETFRSGIIKLIFIVYIIVIEAIQHKYSADGIGWAGQSLAWVDASVLKAGGTGRTRWINIFDGPGVFCVMFTLILPFLLQYLDKGYSKKTKLFALILLGPLLLAIWTSGSRGGFLATLAIFGAYGLSKMHIKMSSMIKVGAFLMIVFMMAPGYMTSIRDKEKSAQHRVDMWIEGIEMVQQNPLFGIGPGNFAGYTGSLIAHNSAIQIMGERGMPGLFFWIALLYLAFKTTINAMQSADRRMRSYYKGLILCLIGYIASSMFVTLEYETLYFILGFSRALDKSDSPVEFNIKDIQRVGMISIGFFIILKIFVQLYY